jgi:hypothetical protein
VIRTLDLGRPSTPDPEHPFEKLFNDMELQKSIVDSTWDEPVTTAPLAKGKEPFFESTQLFAIVDRLQIESYACRAKNPQ